MLTRAGGLIRAAALAAVILAPWGRSPAEAAAGEAGKRVYQKAFRKGLA